MAPNFYTGWGLHFQEGWDLEIILAMVLTGIFISLIFGVLWSVFPTVADGFQVGGHIMAVWALGVASLQFAVSTP
jgi:hypothetical protein